MIGECGVMDLNRTASPKKDRGNVDINRTISPKKDREKC